MFVDYNCSYYTGKYGVTENKVADYIHLHVAAIFPDQRNWIKNNYMYSIDCAQKFQILVLCHKCNFSDSYDNPTHIFCGTVHCCYCNINVLCIFTIAVS